MEHLSHLCCPNQPPESLRRIAALAAIRQRYPVLRSGRQYSCPISFLGGPFEVVGNGELMAWSRILDDEEALCIVNVHGTQSRGADILVDAELSTSVGNLTVVANTAEVTTFGPTVSHPSTSKLTIQRTSDGKVYVEIRNLGPSEVLVLLNHP